jgi:hypothetical protein
MQNHAPAKFVFSALNRAKDRSENSRFPNRQTLQAVKTPE